MHVEVCCCLAASHCHLATQQHNRLLQLPGPQLNSLSKAEWAVSSSELSKAYRKLSILVHPDKMSGEKARQAFEQLKQAYNELRDPEKLVSRLLLLLLLRFAVMKSTSLLQLARLLIGQHWPLHLTTPAQQLTTSCSLRTACWTLAVRWCWQANRLQYVEPMLHRAAKLDEC
jgi:hypothetical protein